ncbi:PH domain-containing protein [Ahniella affigens]|nr:PH domain-containing protein [Ahniella affigens]
MSWLFAMLTQLRPFLLPLLIFLFLGKGNSWELWAALGAVFAAAYAFVHSLFYRYRVDRDELVIREGLLDRTERHIPFARIQNVVQKQNVLHRLFGVTELTLESAGGQEPEARMRVLKLADARALELLLRRQGQAHAPVGDSAALSTEQTDTLLQLPTIEVIKLGLISNRGMLLIGSAAALWSQFGPGWSNNWIKTGAKWFGPWFNDAVHGKDLFWNTIVPAVLVLLALMAGMRLLSVILALLQFHGFQLTQHGERLSTEAGLLSRVRASARPKRIQLFLKRSTWLSRRFNREMLKVDIAGGGAVKAADEHARVKWLAPLARPEQVQQLLGEFAPGSQDTALNWQPLHPRAWIRRCRWPAIIRSMPALLATFVSWFGLVLWILPVWSIAEARGFARFSRYAITDRYFFWRSGWFEQQTVILPIDKIQVIRIQRSPFDRRAGMATLNIDTMGADSFGQPVLVPYLPEATARELAALLRARLLEHCAPVAAPAPAAIPSELASETGI